MKNLIITAAVLFTPFMSYAISPAQLNATIATGYNYTVCQVTHIGPATFNNNTLVDTGYDLDHCVGYNRIADYIRAANLEAARQLLARGQHPSRWPAEVASWMTRYIGGER